MVDGNNGPFTVLTKRTRGAPRTNLFACGQLAAVPPVPGNFVTQRAVRTFNAVHGVLAALLSKSQKRADLKENLSSKRDTASIELELRGWQDKYEYLL